MRPRSTDRPHSPTTRRAILQHGTRLAYASPIIAASMKLQIAGATVGECHCPTGSVAVPDWVIAYLKKWRYTELAAFLDGKCVGCQSGELRLPSNHSILEACQKIGKSYSRVCPDEGNKVLLKDQICDVVISR